MKKNFENLGYLIMGLLILGQCIVGEWFFLGQAIYLIANVIKVVRDFVLGRPASDKVKNIAFVAITVGLICIRIF